MKYQKAFPLKNHYLRNEYGHFYAVLLKCLFAGLAETAKPLSIRFVFILHEFNKILLNSCQIKPYHHMWMIMD